VKWNKVFSEKGASLSDPKIEKIAKMSCAKEFEYQLLQIMLYGSQKFLTQCQSEWKSGVSGGEHIAYLDKNIKMYSEYEQANSENPKYLKYYLMTIKNPEYNFEKNTLKSDQEDTKKLCKEAEDRVSNVKEIFRFDKLKNWVSLTDETFLKPTKASIEKAPDVKEHNEPKNN